MRSAFSGLRKARLQVQHLAAGAAYQGGRSVVSNLAQSGTLRQAIFFGNDALAAGGLMECQHRAISVPRTLAIVGFADLAIAQAMEPAITTVRVPTRRMGEVAAQLLLARLQGKKPVAPVVDLGFELIRRTSA